MEHKLDLTEFAERSLSMLSPLGPMLHRAMEPSVEQARTYFEDGRFDGYVFADLARYHTCCRLESAEMPTDTTFRRLPNNGIAFKCSGAAVRVWKADADGELQGPGSSKTKQAYFDQEFLDLFGPEASETKYAIVWNYDLRSGLLKFSLACPKRFDTYRPWQNPDCHFYIEFPHAATEIVASPRFSGSPMADDDIELQPKKIAGESGDPWSVGNND